jgi:endosialidase-like protein
MTVSSQTSNETFYGNGVTTVWDLPFRFFDNADIHAYLINTVSQVTTPLVLGTDYTLSGAGMPEQFGAAPGKITTTVPVANLSELYVERVMEVEQLTDIVNQGRFFPEVHEDVFDKLTMLIQQGVSWLQRALVRPVGKDYYDAEGHRIANVQNPIDNQDAATKWWASEYFAGLIDAATGLINTTTGILYDAGTLFDYLRDGVSRSVDSVADLRLLNPTRNKRASTKGYYLKGDGGNCDYFVIEGDTTTPDDGFKTIVGLGGVRWGAIFAGSPSVLQAGAKRNDVTAGAINTSAFQTAMDAVGSVYVPGGYYTISGVLNLRSGLFLYGDNPGGATEDASSLPGAARLLFTGAGGACFSQAVTTNAIMHGGIVNISWQTATRDYLLDVYGTLGFSFTGIRAESTALNGGGFRSRQIGSDPTWLNHCSDIEIRTPDASNKHNFDVDWSDSDVMGSALTGGKGAIDRGPGNISWVGNILDRANTLGAGLTLSGSPTSNKQTLVSANKFDDNEGYGLIIDAHENLTGTFTPTIVGNVFRNPSSASAYDILLINVANVAAPVMRGGTIVGNTFSQENRTPYNVDDSTWSSIIIGPNRTPFTAVTPFPTDTSIGSFVAGTTGIHVPDGPSVFRGNATVKSRPGVGVFVTRPGGGAGVYLGVDGAGSPFVGASSDAVGTNKDLNIFTANAPRLTVAADGSAFYPQADNAMSLGFSGKRFSVVWAGTGTINTSNAVEKTPITPFNSSHITVGLRLVDEVGMYQWLREVDNKGPDVARIHIGTTVQRAIEIFEEEGVDPFRFGAICMDEWEARTEILEAEEVDAEGNVLKAAVTQEIPAGRTYGFRDHQLQYLMLAAMAWRQKSIEQRLDALEAK